MSNIWKSAIALTLVLCLSVAFLSCEGNEEEDTLYITEADDTVVDEDEKFPLPVESDEEKVYGEFVTPSNKK